VMVDLELIVAESLMLPERSCNQTKSIALERCPSSDGHFFALEPEMLKDVFCLKLQLQPVTDSKTVETVVSCC